MAAESEEWLKKRRVTAGLTQRELARLSGVAQPNIAAYEAGRRTISLETENRLRAALDTPSLAFVRRHGTEIAAAAARHRLGNVRIFGSLARGEAGPGSDVDLLVHPDRDASVFDLAGFMAEVEGMLGIPVDVVSDRATGVIAQRIALEAVPL